MNEAESRGSGFAREEINKINQTLNYHQSRIASLEAIAEDLRLMTNDIRTDIKVILASAVNTSHQKRL
jgi:prefoldin subunit 5